MMNCWLSLSKRVESQRIYQAMVTWEMMAAIKKIANMLFILKGVATAEDAKIAVDHGVDVVYVSNHGGRQLDQGRGTMDILPEVVAAVNGKADVLLDGSVLRGIAVIKVIVLGAKAVI